MSEGEPVWAQETELVRAQDISGGVFGGREVALVDLLDRVLTTGVVLAGDVTISLAGVDLVRISLRALVTSIMPAEERGLGP